MNSAGGDPPLFEARDLTRVHHPDGGNEVRALDGVSLRIPKGAFAVVTGPSGGGKTTLLALLGALDRPTSGTVRFEGRDLAALSENGRGRVRGRIGFVFQGSPMIRSLPLWENVTYPLVPRGAGAAERRSLAAGLLDRVGVPGRLDALPQELSGGERRRAGIARALSTGPEALLADEPTSELDRDSAASVLELFRDHHAQGGTVVVATHDPALLRLSTMRVRLLHGRRIDERD
jgi:putative ABC transport system ATP-binding protein